MKESYELLGLDESASMEEVTARYEELKAKYNEEKWKDGEEGNRAARMLDKLDAAYAEICDDRKTASRDGASASSAFDEVASCIRSGDLSRAQQLLDAFNERSAEWHYLQSVVFYRKNWINESKKQLEIALQMEPSNEKYRSAYDKLRARAEYTTNTGGAPNTNPDVSAEQGKQMGGNWCVTCANACYTFFCITCFQYLCCGCR